VPIEPLAGDLPSGYLARHSRHFGNDFHTSYMPVVRKAALGNFLRIGQSFINPATWADEPACAMVPTAFAGLFQRRRYFHEVVLDPSKHYYISVLPGDAY